MLYACIMADPPWQEHGGTGSWGPNERARSMDVRRYYRTLPADEIIQTMITAPVWRPNPAGSHLWLWVTDQFLPTGLRVMEALGYRYVRTLCWGKLTSRECIAFGQGQYLRGAHELCLFGVRGRLRPVSRSQRSLVLACREKHSRKPLAAVRAIEAVSPGPRLEMFATQRREGWDSWGDQLRPQ